MSDCLFCKIIAKEIPSASVYEDDFVYAFLDIKPVNPGHVLVVPKAHSVNLLDMTEETLVAVARTTQRIAKAVCEAVGTDAFNLEMNNGAVAGQVVPHAHLHIVPRRADDGLTHWPGHPYAEGEGEKVAAKIRGLLL